MSALECIVGSAAAVAHAYFLYNGYTTIASGQDDLSKLDWVTPSILPVFYLAMIYGGNAMMSGRKPFSMKASMSIYNLYATLLSAAMMLLLGRELLATSWSSKFDRSAVPPAAAAALWLNYQSKFIEYFDTIFMVLRCKREQITVSCVRRGQK